MILSIFDWLLQRKTELIDCFSMNYEPVLLKLVFFGWHELQFCHCNIKSIKVSTFLLSNVSLFYSRKVWKVSKYSEMLLGLIHAISLWIVKNDFFKFKRIQWNFLKMERKIVLNLIVEWETRLFFCSFIKTFFVWLFLEFLKRNSHKWRR